MRIPKRIEVLGVDYETRYRWNLRDDEHGLCRGLCDDGEKVIWLDRSVVGDEREGVYLHECFHAVFSELVISGLIGEHDIPLPIEEILVESLQRFITSRFHLRLKRE